MGPFYCSLPQVERKEFMIIQFLLILVCSLAGMGTLVFLVSLVASILRRYQSTSFLALIYEEQKEEEEC